jgi:hypothetical protein
MDEIKEHFLNVLFCLICKFSYNGVIIIKLKEEGVVDEY